MMLLLNIDIDHLEKSPMPSPRLAGSRTAIVPLVCALLLLLPALAATASGPRQALAPSLPLPTLA
ncbi:MAG: hypothetical protein ABT11_20815 [Novosphingobium sp. SCN 66-18]|nr:MAG: hypothetical protein ABT11_20815 [Novosphingobium sp. SCN 66-18]